MSKIIIGLTGQIASGKDVNKKYLEEKYGAKSFRFSTIMREIVTRLGLEINRHNLVNISLCLRKTFGEDLFAKTMANDVMNDAAEIIVVDGIRRLADIEYLKKVPGFHLISVDASPEIRYDRLIKRNENKGDSEKTYEQFLADEKLETEASIPSVMTQAEVTINNNGNFEELYQQIEVIMQNLNK